MLRVLPRRRHVSRLSVESVGARGFAVSDENRAGARVLGAGGRLPVWGWDKFYLHRTYEGLREAVDLVRIEV